MHVLQLISPILILLSPDITEYNKIYEQNMTAYNLKKTTTACLLFIITPSLKEKQVFSNCPNYKLDLALFMYHNLF